MDFEIYCDESCLEALKNTNAHPYIGIGGIWIPSVERSKLKQQLLKIKLKYNINAEFKWNKVSPAYFEFYKEIKKYQKEFSPSKEIEGYASAAIVGEKGYPSLKTYNISNEKKENSFFRTNQLVKKDYSEILRLKARNVLGNTSNINIKKPKEMDSDSLI